MALGSCRRDAGGQRAQDKLGGCGDGDGSRVIELSARRFRKKVRVGRDGWRRRGRQRLRERVRDGVRGG